MQEYIELEQRLHLLCQPLAKIAANLLPEKEDYSHTNLGLDVLTKRILTRWIPNGQHQVCVAIDLKSESMQILDHTFRIIASHEIRNKTLAKLEHELQKNLNELGLLEEGFQMELAYAVEDYGIAGDPFQSFNTNELERWISHRSMANTACQRFLLHLNYYEEVRIWPHHFDTGMFTKIGGDLGIGFGLAVKDSLHDAPYYYLSGYAGKKGIEMDGMPELEYGSWHVEKWKGAALPLTNLEGIPFENQWQILTEFIFSTCNWYVTTNSRL